MGIATQQCVVTLRTTLQVRSPYLSDGDRLFLSSDRLERFRYKFSRSRRLPKCPTALLPFLPIFQFDQRSDIHHREFTHPYFQRNREDLLPLLVGEVLARQPQGFTSPRVAQVGKILHLCRRLTDTERQLGTLQAELKDTRKILDTIQPAPAAGKVDYSLPPLRTLLKDVKWESSN